MYLPQVQHASECEWAHRRDVEYPARAREAALRRAGQPDPIAGGESVLMRWARWIHAIGARPLITADLGAARSRDGVA